MAAADRSPPQSWRSAAALATSTGPRRRSAALRRRRQRVSGCQLQGMRSRVRRNPATVVIWIGHIAGRRPRRRTSIVPAGARRHRRSRSRGIGGCRRRLATLRSAPREGRPCPGERDGEQLLGAGWQRCRVHLTRNAQDLVPRSARSMVASAVRSVIEQPDGAAARAQGLNALHLDSQECATLNRRFLAPRLPASAFGPLPST
jgi:hypothetical protein